jgi:hypothetical protein
MRDSSLRKIDSFSNLQARFKRDWREDLQNIETIAPTDTEKTIYFKAAQVVSRKEYSEFLLAAADLAVEGEISQRQLEWALRPSTEHLRGFWSEEMPDPVQLDIISRCRIVFADKPDILKFFDGVVSGEVLAEAKKFRERYYGSPAVQQPPGRSTPDNKAVETGENVEPDHIGKIIWVAAGLCVVAAMFFLVRRSKQTGS